MKCHLNAQVDTLFSSEQLSAYIEFFSHYRLDATAFIRPFNGTLLNEHMTNIKDVSVFSQDKALPKNEQELRKFIQRETQAFLDKIETLDTVSDRQALRRSMLDFYNAINDIDRLYIKSESGFVPALKTLPFIDTDWGDRPLLDLRRLILKGEGVDVGHGQIGIKDEEDFIKIQRIRASMKKTAVPYVNQEEGTSLLIFINGGEIGVGATKRSRIAFKVDGHGAVTFYANPKSTLDHWTSLKDLFIENDIQSPLRAHKHILPIYRFAQYNGKKRDVSMLAELGRPFITHDFEDLLEKLPQMTMALLDLERQGICHNDVKSEILL